MYLYKLYSHTDGDYKNRLYIIHMPTDVAIAFDRMTDGQANPSAGAFRRYADNAVGTDGTSATWPDASTTKTVNVSLEIGQSSLSFHLSQGGISSYSFFYMPA